MINQRHTAAASDAIVEIFFSLLLLISGDIKRRSQITYYLHTHNIMYDKKKGLKKTHLRWIRE